jgi:hypothetical protein
MKKLIACIFTFCLSSFLFSQSYSGPESVEYDFANNRWLIANHNNGTVISRDMNGNFAAFVSGMSSGPYGIEILGNVLYCCHNGGSIRGFNLTTGAQVFNLNLGASFLNGICSDGGSNLFVTDFSAKKIYRVNVADSSYNVFVTGLSKSPNGIIYEGSNQRLVFVTWGSSALVQQVNLSDSVVSTLLTTTLTNIDGIAADAYGNYYVSTWGNNSVRKYTANFTSGPVTVVTGLSSPADLFYNAVTDTLAIPNSGTANNVKWIGFNPLGIDNAASSQSNIEIFPQPSSDGIIFISGIKKSGGSVKVFDLAGRMIYDEKIISSSFENGKLQLNLNCKAGEYLLEVIVEGEKFTRKLLIDDQH